MLWYPSTRPHSGQRLPRATSPQLSSWGGAWYGRARFAECQVIEVGTLDRKRITALAGLAPFACESGLQRGRRAIWGGRGDARAMFFLAAQSAARWNVPLRLFYQRLVGRGKSKKAALAAVARQLLIAINAMMRDQRPWQPAIVAEPSWC